MDEEYFGPVCKEFKEGLKGFASVICVLLGLSAIFVLSLIAIIHWWF